MAQLLTGAYVFFASRNLLKIPLKNVAPMAWTEYSKQQLNVNDINITKWYIIKTVYVTFTSSLHLGRPKKHFEAKK